MKKHVDEIREEYMDTKAYELYFSEKQNWDTFDAYFKKCMGDMNAWFTYVDNHIMKRVEQKKLTMKYLASQIKVDYKTLREIKKGRIQRDTLIALGILLDMTHEQINDMLLHAKYHKLYPKTVEDALWCYMIDHLPESLDVEGETIKEKYGYWQKKYDDLFLEYERIIKGEKPFAAYGTILMENVITQERTFEEIMLEIIPGFDEAYTELKVFLDEWRTSFFPLSAIEGNDNRDLGQAYYRLFHKFKEKGKLPSRAFFIAFGIQAGMKKEEIDSMLSLAKMQPLYARDLVDARLIYYISQKEYSIESLAYDLTEDIEVYKDIPLIEIDLKAILKYL